MKQNKYNDKTFFEKYSKMNRSTKGLEGAGEWKTLDKMLEVAKEKTSKEIKYICQPIEDIRFEPNSFDVVISSLTFHYLESFDEIVRNVSDWLVNGGEFVFSVEHPVFTSYGTQDWYRNANGDILHFPVDNYFSEGQREATFLDEKVQKYHKTLTTYLNTLLQNGFEITGVVEPQPSKEMLEAVEGMKDELRRPMMLIISARKS